MDTGDRGELVAANLTVDDVRRYVDADSLAYLTLDRLLAATGAPGAGFCAACLTGDYPVAVDDREAAAPTAVELRPGAAAGATDTRGGSVEAEPLFGG
jgi:amidophosphoribosyltransferase